MKRPLSTNPAPDAIYESPFGENLLREIRLIAALRWEAPCKFDAPPRPVITQEPQDTARPADYEVIRKAAEHIARRRGIPNHVDLEAIETAGMEAFSGAVSYGKATADDNFDVRAFAVDKARLAMDAAVRRINFKTEAQALPYDVELSDPDEPRESHRDKHGSRHVETAQSGQRGARVSKKHYRELVNASQGSSYLSESEKRSLAQIGLAARPLTARLRIVIEKTIDGLSQDEIAILLGVSQGTVSRRYNQAVAEISGKF